ncbi:uncharacterized protein LOC110633941 isoform X2 [Hevea brasiliensis]|uniref:uncharacterized protein LOC110633941 isoform X2 n=1 Tax=Hevea brasiliensis TaxID=3981 RepID=UPI0025E188A6|nr:uncharacterized protein LOC110633941 isoform X2 [Hevea brasiliensis]
MSGPEENLVLEDKMLSLLDVCFEDDCLYNSPSRDHQFPHFPEKKIPFALSGIVACSDKQTEHETVQMVGLDEPENSLEGGEQATQPFELAEQEKTRKNEKYNLRKSLAWDSAFFTSAGVLEPEELSTIIGGTEKGGKNHILLGIEEDIHRSTDSISTFATDNSTLGTLEDDLFGDIRASIQKSSKGSNAAVSHGKAGSGVNEGQLIKSSEKVDIVVQKKLKTKAAPRKLTVAIKGSGKLANQVSPTPQASKCGLMNEESTSSVRKPPNRAGRVSPILTTATKRASLGANHVKMEKDSAKYSTGHSDKPKNLTVRGAKPPYMGGSRNTVPKPTLPFKSSLQSSMASKSELRTSSSTIDSLGSLSSDGSSRCSLYSEKRKIDSKTGNHFSTVSTVKSTLKTESRSKNQSMSPRISPSVTKAKFFASISPASSISEWSLESMSPTSTLNKRTNSSRPSLDTRLCSDAYDNGDASQVLDSQNHSSDKCSVGHGTQVIGLPSECGKRVSTGSGAVVRPDSIKPSGLRMPSPKIGFFDGVRSEVRTPSGRNQSHPAVPRGLPRYGVENVSPSGRSNEAKLGKLQPIALAVRGTKASAQQNASEIKPRPPLPLQAPPGNASKVCSASRNGKYCPGMPLKVQSRISPGNGRQDNLKAEKIAPKDCDTTINNPDIRNESLHKNKMSPQSENKGPVKDADFTRIIGGLGVTCNLSSVSEAENIIMSQKVGENAAYGQKKILGLLSNINEKGKTCFEDQVDHLASQVGAMDIHREIQQKPVLDSCSLHQVNESRAVKTSAQEEFAKLLMPSSALTPTKGVKVEIYEN